MGLFVLKVYTRIHHPADKWNNNLSLFCNAFQKSELLPGFFFELQHIVFVVYNVLLSYKFQPVH